MAPHALNSSLIPSGVNSPSGAASLSEIDDVAILNTIESNPFDNTVDPETIRGSNYTSGITVINQAVYSTSSKIFSYETLGSDNLIDSHIQLWSKHYHRLNAFGVVPFFHKLQVRSGAANTMLGFFGRNGTNGQPITALLGANALNYMLPTLSSKSNSLPLSLNVSAVDFDDASSSLVSNYQPVLGVARTLNYPVFTATDAFNGVELQHLTVLNQYVAALTGSPSINLFEGVESSKNFTKYHNLLSVGELGELYQQLLNNTTTEATSTEDLVLYALNKLNSITGASYAPFEYVGAARPEIVFVVYGSNESTRLAAIVDKIKQSVKVGLVQIRIPLPFYGAEFARIIPKTTKKLVVVSPSAEVNSIKADISTALFLNGVYNRFDLDEFKYPLDFQWTPITITKILSEFVEDLNPNVVLEEPDRIISSGASQITANSSPDGSYLIWGKDNSEFLATVRKLALSLSLDDSKVVSVRTKFDNINGGGLFQSQLISSDANAPTLNQVDSADVVLIEDASLLESYDVLATAKPGAIVLIGTEKAITEEDFTSKLPVDFKRTLAVNKNSLVLIDLSIVADLEALSDSTKGFSKEFLIQLAFWKASFPELEGFIVNKLLQANGNSFELLAVVLDKFINAVTEKNGLKDIKVLDEWVNLENAEDTLALPYFPVESSFYPNPRIVEEDVEEVNHKGYVDLATKLVFPEAYGVTKDLRPDLPVKNFVVKVQESLRLTPQEYSRNIFHIEFDISGTGLTYDIGEALGIHGRNHPEDVEDFLKFYGVDGNTLVEITNKDDSSLVEIRSARQALGETMDFLGKPPKRFYESLAEYASDEKEKQALTKLASGEGAEELKKRQEVDFCTYFDILEEFKSARPEFQDLVKIISPLKRREYSIASSQKLHPNSVHLLVVVVDWTDPKGRKRWGHCSKYMSDLRIGDELVVSVKPSVMKLPPLSKQPIVMSGLGTGLAPFKAFIEEKIWQQEQGMEIGDIYLYMGSRHKKEEYLYGELWEAYKDAGILTHIGAAFSRDQPEKIYIQDKIRESIEELTDAIVNKEGSFYLCGPTWPVPDITACLEDIVQNAAKKRGETIKDLSKVIEDMKEEGRYILEVY